MSKITFAVQMDSCFLFAFLLTACSVMSAQYGIAPDNQYPISYQGTMFTGTVSRTTPDTMTLTFARGKKVETFDGYVTAGCMLPTSKSTYSRMPLSKIPVGTVLSALYEGHSVEVNGQKQHQNQIIAVSLIEGNGKKISKANQVIYYCIPEPFHVVSKAFGRGPSD